MDIYTGNVIPRIVKDMDSETVQFLTKEKEARGRYNLPKEKALVYYRNGKMPPIPVIQWFVNKEFDNWAVLEIILQDDDTVRIHSDYLVEMQQASFLNDLNSQMK